MSEAADARAAAAESRKSRLQILRERQKKLRESYKVQIDMSRRNLDGDESGGRLSPMPAVSEAKDSAATEPAKTADPGAKPEGAVDSTAAPVTPSTAVRPTIPTTPNTARLVQTQTENEELKRQIVALKADRELLLERQMERFASASEQLNEMEILLEDYRSIAEEAEENNAVLKAQLSLMTSEQANWKKAESELKDRVQQQQDRLDSSVQAMNDLEKALNKAQDDLQMSDQHKMNLEHQLRSVASTNAQIFQGQVHGGATYFPPPQQTVYYPVPGDGGAGRGSNRLPKKPFVGGGGPGMPPQRRGSHNTGPGGGGPPQRRGSYNKQGGNNPGGGPHFAGNVAGGPPSSFHPNAGIGAAGGGLPNFNPSAPNFNPNAANFTPQSPNPGGDYNNQGSKKKRR
ncbi:unnamed protein product [Cylindrotheca closterium]|uniref:Uncharacterized protein n=1 Tax=Cylindrotheca closterium TaxID=2856 RepID=A0AAD2JJ33_9STRA|nr:unnamed protein product [Cylindrotheca closterium]